MNRSRRGKPELADEWILGSGDFVERIIREAEARMQRQYTARERGQRVEFTPRVWNGLPLQ